MPIYEYRCNSCGYKFEALRKFEERDNPIECPTCKSSDTRREMSAFGTAKGSGSISSSGTCGSSGSSRFG
ncbi:putative regulatory protein, FmdB family [Caldanaerovirga acetigignens]|uniref:Putative regulatory protein, FmdB family n=1 Tax=Caldanaerovirga acetigignens TaxID=447595 RepID=A0A1M7FH24_9FIRM|nr:zinc ribbon domain-containing protein [Caldanaerovirga acetigignens]SHM02937.1 putative regulatory protein, FmdB family [Caldanaerovirga acetigignens]